MMTLDPTPPSFNDSKVRRDAWWSKICTVLPRSKVLKQNSGKALTGLRASLDAQDWGTPDAPGGSWWTLRALLTQLDRQPQLTGMLATFLAEQPSPLPDFLADSWSTAYDRTRDLTTLVKPVIPYPGGITPPAAEEATQSRRQLFTQLLRHWPVLARWVCQDRSVLVGADELGQPYEGKHWQSLLAGLLPYRTPAPGQEPWAGAIDLLLATDPLAGLPMTVRQNTYGQLALRHQPLVAHITAPDEVTFQVLKPFSLTLTQSSFEALVQARDLEGFDRMVAQGGFDPLKRDRYGQTWFHQSVNALQMKTKVSSYDNEWVFKTGEDLQVALTTLTAFWDRFLALGVPVQEVSAPEQPPRMSKRTGKPVRTNDKDQRWPWQAAMPGESLGVQIARLTQEGRFPEQLPSILRQWQLQHWKPATPATPVVAPRARRRV